jgi:hypothetical protein
MRKTAMQELARWIKNHKAEFKDTNLYWNLYATAIQSLEMEKKQIDEASKTNDYYKDTYNVF